MTDETKGEDVVASDANSNARVSGYEKWVQKIAGRPLFEPADNAANDNGAPSSDLYPDGMKPVSKGRRRVVAIEVGVAEVFPAPLVELRVWYATSEGGAARSMETILIDPFLIDDDLTYRLERASREVIARRWLEKDDADQWLKPKQSAR